MPNTSSAETACKLVEQFKSTCKDFSVNTEAYHKLLCLCELADIVSEEFCGDIIAVQTEPTNKKWSVVLKVDDIVFENGRSHRFFKLIKNADYLSFSKSKDGMLRIEFGVKDLWVAK